MSRTLFRYSPGLTDRFPTIRGGIIHAVELSNGDSPPDLRERYRSEQERVVADVGERPLSELVTIAAWRRAFAAFGVKPTQYRSAAEALLRRLTKKGDIPSINLLVDCANLVSIRHALPVAVFDQRDITGTTAVRFANGTELFTDLGSLEPVHPEPGEVIFADDASLISARRWCWRQSAHSAARPDTSEALITVEGHHETASTDVQAALDDIRALLADYQPQAGIRWALLSPDNPELNAG